MDRPGVRQVSEGSEDQGNMEETGCEIICGDIMEWTGLASAKSQKAVEIREIWRNHLWCPNDPRD